MSILKQKNIFAKGYTRSLSEEVFFIKRVPKENLIDKLNGEVIIGKFYEKDFKKTD